MMIFRVLCGEWIEPLYDSMRATGPESFLFFLTALVIGNFLVGHVTDLQVIDGFILHRPYFQGNRSQTFFKSLRASDIPGRSKRNQSCNAKFAHVDSPSRVTRNFRTPPKHPRNVRGYIIRRRSGYRF